MTDNLNETSPVNTAATTEHSQTTWQLNALTAALGDLSLSVSDSLSVGRGSDNDVVLGSKAISRNHALLSVLNTELYVKDLGSSNGTFVNDERIENNKSILLKAEDKLGFASFDFQVIAPVAEQVEAPTSDIAVEPEDIVGTVQENLQADKAKAHAATDTSISSAVDSTKATNTTNDSLVTESAIEPTVPAAAVEELIEERASANAQTVSTNTEDQPVVKETIIGEVLNNANATTKSAAPIKEDAVEVNSPSSTVVDTETLPTAATEETLMAHDKEQQTIDNNKAVTEPVLEQPVVKEPVVEERVTEELIVEQPVVEEPATEGKLMHEKAGHQEAVVSPEHDKTTTTALQEEADPDVLRAKQAATAQFSGTANLGQGRDLGTTGNNAMDQAINNPANAETSEKKPSGGWFIWVFIAVLIIAIALWLFNKGGV